MSPSTYAQDKPCYAFQVKRNSMIEDGILDGDWVVIEQRNHAQNGKMVQALK
jgi:repressor LexA